MQLVWAMLGYSIQDFGGTTITEFQLFFGHFRGPRIQSPTPSGVPRISTGGSMIKSLRRLSLTRSLSYLCLRKGRPFQFWFQPLTPSTVRNRTFVRQNQTSAERWFNRSSTEPKTISFDDVQQVDVAPIILNVAKSLRRSQSSSSM